MRCPSVLLVSRFDVVAGIGLVVAACATAGVSAVISDVVIDVLAAADVSVG